MKINKKTKNILMSALILCLMAYGAAVSRNSFKVETSRSIPAETTTPSFNRDLTAVDFSGLSFNPWDYKEAAAQVPPQPKRPYTIMIYMNGSDLESQEGAATDDLIEILNSGVDTENVNIIIFTGGTNRWQNNIVPENQCVLWRISQNGLERLTEVGLRNMGDPGTLSSFINFSAETFPADKYGLILWDHGGGSIAGYGHDEKFNNSNLTLLDMNYAFENSLQNVKLEFLGFDSCLMATVEMAVVASDYANYLIASQDLEPGGGWDYNFLSVLNKSPGMDGAALGKAITDYFMNYYGRYSKEALTLSVTDLSKAINVMSAMENLMALCDESLVRDKSDSFAALARKRSGTKTFGAGSPRDNESDMVDLGDMARSLYELYPEQSAALQQALDEAVVYNRHNSHVDLKGLSAYYIYGGKHVADESLDIYAALNMSPSYTGYLNRFYSYLKERPFTRSAPKNTSVSDKVAIWKKTGDSLYEMQGIKIADPLGNQAVIDTVTGLWPKINGIPVCLYPVNASKTNRLYAVPASLNGRDCDIIISIGDSRQEGEILGTRQEDGVIIQKGYDEINIGDKIAFYQLERNFENNSENWRAKAEITVDKPLNLSWSPIEGDINYNIITTDIYGNENYGGLNKL